MPRNGAFVQSILFHGLVAGAFVIGLPHLGRDIAPEQPILTVEIVTTTPQTNLDEGVKTKVDTKAEEEVQPRQTTQAPAPKPAKAPKAPEATPIPTPEAKPAPIPKPKKQVLVKPPPKKPVDKFPARKPANETQLALASKLQDLTEKQAALRRQEEEEKKKKEKEDAQKKLAQITGQALNAPRRTSAPTGISLGDRLRDHIAKSWSPPPGAAGADALIIDIIVSLNKQAVVEEVEIVDKARFKTNDTYRAAANAARRAIFDASPLPLPPNQFEQWKELRIKFDPSFITRR